MNAARASVLTLILCLSLHSVGHADEDEIVVYPAFTATEAVTIEGRVVERKGHEAAAMTDSRRTNMRRLWELMVNEERKHYPVTVKLAEREWLVTTDREGYFRVEANGLNAIAPGWHDVTATTSAGLAQGRLLKLPSTNVHGIISDVDDTILVTEVNSKRRMLATTFFFNALQREVVPGVVELYRHLASANTQPENAPIIFLSASPRQLHTSIDSFLHTNQFPRGVLITKRVTDDRTSEPLTDQVRYKTAKIEMILATWPRVTFTLIGDDGEYDPEIYADITHRFPDRIAATLIRRVNPDPNRTAIVGQAPLDEAIKRARER